MLCPLIYDHCLYPQHPSHGEQFSRLSLGITGQSPASFAQKRIHIMIPMLAASQPPLILQANQRGSCDQAPESFEEHVINGALGFPLILTCAWLIPQVGVL